MSYLVVQHPGHEDARVRLTDQELTVGRLPENELAIDAESVSRRHALIRPTDHGYSIVDLGSRNGTWVNGQPASDVTVPLRPGDEVELGGQGVVLRYFADDGLPEAGMVADATALFTRVPKREPGLIPDVLAEGERWMKVLRVTPWLRLAGAVLGAAAAALAFAWWLSRFL